MRIKKILGFCERKGCWNRYRASIDIYGHKKGERKEVIRNYHICDQHLREFLKDSQPWPGSRTVAPVQQEGDTK